MCIRDSDKTTHDLIRAAGGRKEKDLAGLFSTYTANDPQYLVTIDREKAKSLHIPLSQITDTLSVYMGSAYINDFDFNNRSYRVYVQADKQFRSHPQDIGQYYVRSDSGAMIPLQNLVTIDQTAAPQVINHYNLFRSSEIDGSAAPGFSSGPVSYTHLCPRQPGRLSEPAQFDDIILKSNADGTLVRLKDVGHSELGAEDYTNDLEYNGVDAIGIAVTQLSTANALDVHQKCVAELDRLSKHFPPGMKYEIAFDTTDAVGESIRDVISTLGTAIVLVILVIFVFLEDWRSTIIPAVTIPVSLIGTFAFVKLLGFSINTLTLFGVTLATGLVVDDAIVVIENIERHLQEGELNPVKAASDAMKEVTGAVIATSLVLVAVFVPVAFFPGTTGILFRQFALTIAFSIAISAFNALTLTPALSALLLGRQHGEKNWFFKIVDRVLSAVNNGYVRALRAFLRFELSLIHI